MKHPSKPEKWSIEEIEADSQGYKEAQETARKNRERDEREDRTRYQPEATEQDLDEQARRVLRSETMRVI